MLQQKQSYFLLGVTFFLGVADEGVNFCLCIMLKKCVNQAHMVLIQSILYTSALIYLLAKSQAAMDNILGQFLWPEQYHIKEQNL